MGLLIPLEAETNKPPEIWVLNFAGTTKSKFMDLNPHVEPN